MNENKLKRLFAMARQETPPEPDPDFASEMLRAIRQEPAAAESRSWDMVEQLNDLFPRAAVAAAVIIGLCVAADLGLTAAGWPELGDGAAQMSSEYLFNPGDF